jgi:predicted DNA-binding transcriptional regulator AlpA
MNQLPDTGFLKLAQILGNPKAIPPVPPIIPVSKSTWFAGVKANRFPQPVRFGTCSTFYKVEDIRKFVESA